MLVQDEKKIGEQVRIIRQSQGLTQALLAQHAGVGVRFISDLENGKPTIELGKVLQVLDCLGIMVSLQGRTIDT